MESGIDETLRERAEHVSEALQEVPNRGFDMIDSATDDFTQLGVYVQVLKPDGEVVARSYNIGPHSLPVDQAVIDQVLGGDTPYTTTTLNDQQIRLYYQPIIRDGIPVGVVQVGQSLQELTETLLRLKALYYDWDCRNPPTGNWNQLVLASTESTAYCGDLHELRLLSPNPSI